MNHPQLLSPSRALFLGSCLLALTCAAFAAKVKPAATARVKPSATAKDFNVRDCLMVNGHAGVSIGSEMSGSVRHVRVERCEVRGTDRLIRIKSQRGRGGVVEDVVVENCRGRNLLNQAIEITLLYSPRLPPEPFSERTPVFRNFTFRDLDCDGAPQAILIKGLEESLVSNLGFTRVNVRAQQGVQVNHGANIRFDHCKIEAASGPAFSSANSRDLMANGQKF